MAFSASFFSYKGGAGRTTSTLNTSYYLIREVIRPTNDHPLLIIDADTESAGISYLLTRNMASKYISSDRSVQGLCRDARNNGALFNPDNGAPMPDLISAYSALSKKFIPVGDQFGVEEQSVLLLRSNVSGFSMSPEDYVEPVERLIKLVKDVCKCSVIFDTPTGTQALTNCALRQSDIIVCHMRPTAQFQQGTKDYLERYLQQPDTNFKTIILCPSVVPLDTVVIDGKTYPSTYCEQLKTFAEEMKTIVDNSMSLEVRLVDLMTKPIQDQWANRFQYASDIMEYRAKNVVGIPEITRFKWREGLLPTVPSLTKEEKLACERYFYLANIVAGNVI